MKSRSYRALCLVITITAASCSNTDWERQQISPDSSTWYVAKNEDGDGFVIGPQFFIASTKRVTSVLDSGSTYPFELYLSGEGYVTLYKGTTPEWYNPYGILLVSDLNKLFSANPQLREYFINADKMKVVILNDSTKMEVFRIESMTKGAEAVFKM